MTRGRPVTKGLDTASAVARTRGTVMRFMNEADGMCDFVIVCAGILAFVRVKRIGRIRCTVQEIEAGLHEQLTRLRSIPVSGLVTREIWVYTKKGAWRYFRDCETGLIEIDRDGHLVKVPEKDPHVSGAAIAGSEAGIIPQQG